MVTKKLKIYIPTVMVEWLSYDDEDKYYATIFFN